MPCKLAGLPKPATSVGACSREQQLLNELVIGVYHQQRQEWYNDIWDINKKPDAYKKYYT
jgi:hypothetical protein